jgi:excisionase family DNA binding protein
MGGEIWHQMFAARARMLEYALELEGKIRDCGLKDQEKTLFILALCGAGFHWHEDELEDFVQFYRTGRHRSDDPFSRVEANYAKEKNLALERTISRFACMRRRQGELFHTRLNWNVQPPRDPEFDQSLLGLQYLFPTAQTGPVLWDNQTSAWLTVNQAAQYLSIKPRTLAQWARQGNIKGYVLSGTRRHVWRFLRSDLVATMHLPTVALSKRRKIN